MAPVYTCHIWHLTLLLGTCRYTLHILQICTTYWTFYMIIRHSLPQEGYTKIDRTVFTNPLLSDGAKVLYGYMCGLRNGANFSDKYILKALSISTRALARRKKELKDFNLILIEQISVRIYVVYIGHSTFSAERVKQMWEKDESDL